VSVSSKRVSVLVLVSVLAAALALPATGAAAGGKKPAPSLRVLGFGVNQLFVAKGTTVKSESMCDAIVGADSPVGPPQQIYLSVAVRATGIPKKAPTQYKDKLPYGDDPFAVPDFTDPVPFSRAFAAGTFPVGGATGSSKDLYYLPIVGSNAEAGQYEGPSAEEFDGEYSFTASVKVGGRTLRSTATVNVDCPSLR
jgi:hypothetical protein